MVGPGREGRREPALPGTSMPHTFEHQPLTWLGWGLQLRSWPWLPHTLDGRGVGSKVSCEGPSRSLSESPEAGAPGWGLPPDLSEVPEQAHWVPGSVRPQGQTASKSLIKTVRESRVCSEQRVKVMFFWVLWTVVRVL